MVFKYTKMSPEIVLYTYIGATDFSVAPGERKVMKGLKF